MVELIYITEEVEILCECCGNWIKIKQTEN